MGRHKRISDDELLAVAREVFIEKGASASTREIARRAGCSEAVLYQRHGTKLDLFVRAMVPPALDVEALLQAPDSSCPNEHLEEIALGMLSYFRELQPILQPLLSAPDFDFEDFAARHPDAPLHRLRQGLVATLRRMQARGRLREDLVVEPAALMLFASIHSLAIFERMGAHGGAFDEALVRGMVRALWRGLAP
ncbi:MAG: TetR/AcrR family transcriptional regulator [Myxococcales bacterium]|nr:TetR/AcrR family transcriptional regulator [Myxococcales bacterium]MCB9755778.1 TetR/AcrR family transcriptional regulator [Myxococcales bacterium]